MDFIFVTQKEIEEKYYKKKLKNKKCEKKTYFKNNEYSDELDYYTKEKEEEK